MSREELVALVCCDLTSIVRGRALFSSSLDAHRATGVSWVPANHALTPMGPVADPNPFGSTGDLRLLPDLPTRVRVENEAGGSALDFVLCDIVETDGEAWPACPRSFLRDALALLERELGARAQASFEHEFQLLADGTAPAPFSLEAMRRAEPFASDVMSALLAAGVEPERFLPEYARHQFEVPIAPAEGLTSADRSVVLREVVREVARRLHLRASFAPLLDPDDAGNGVHIHISLLDRSGRSLFYDAARPGALSELGGQFAAGVLRHARALGALSAASPVSSARLAPHRWSAGAVALAERNREALVRIPPLVTLGGRDSEGQLRLEYRGADATANPHLALGAILRAGLEGVRAQLDPPALLDRDPAELDAADAERFGVGALPRSLEESLQALADDELAQSWLGTLLYESYTCIKRAEIAAAEPHDLAENCRRYAAIY